MKADPPVLRAEKLVKRFGGLVALDRVSIEVRPRTITMLIGPNGSGKTTLINVISGVYKPEAGRVLFNGMEITGWPPHRVYEAGVVRTFQIPEPFTRLTVLENLLVAARGHAGESPIRALFRRCWEKYEEELVDRAFKVLDILGLESSWNKPAYQLSGGQLKLLELGRALMGEPRLLLLDEPVAGVNPKLAYELMEHLVRLKEELGLSFLIVEHRLDIVLDYVDYAYAMHRGRVIEEGAPDEVLSSKAVAKAYLGA